ncbi:MAG: peptidoglycan DD-metalloendopeptidase family protein [Campylobacterota bacterium]|nr:peptidoglycan DD-metalloendopeptidase family protein [Campylobacterota bacterium]
MIHFLLTFVLILSSVALARNIDAEISQTSKKLKTFNKDNTKISNKMAKNAKNILKQKNIVLKQSKELNTLEEELALKEQDYSSSKAELILLKDSNSELNDEQAKIEQELVFAIARNASLMLVLDDKDPVNEQSLIVQESLYALSRQIQNEIKSLNSNYLDTTKQIELLQARITELHSTIAMIDAKKQELLVLKRSNSKQLKALQTNQNIYKKSFEKLKNEQKSLRKTLAKLNIVKEKEKERIAREKREAKEEKKRLAQLEIDRKKAIETGKELPEVKKQSIYHSVKTKKYRGKKTIAPLSSYTLVKKFGPYTDPIYDIKIFNESVSLKPKAKNAKVKNVLNGKVILAKETSLLNNIIIIEHSNGMHTIYAHLSQIAPTIKKGKRLKKGSVIGRVSDELMFEVTQKNYHINPMQLIN